MLNLGVLVVHFISTVLERHLSCSSLAAPVNFEMAACVLLQVVWDTLAYHQMAICTVACYPYWRTASSREWEVRTGCWV